MKFTKMHGLGNDYIYVDCTNNKMLDNPSEISKKVSNRHFGIGSDGLILICDSDKCDFKMRMFNADGSEAEMCGNGIRCVGKYVYDFGLTNKVNVIIETKNGQATVYYLEEGQYRIVEIKSPDGKELPKNPNIATFFVDSNGKAYGNSIISNKSKTEKIKVVPSAQAEFIVGIRTGQNVVKYGLIIAVLSIAISVLMFINNKSDKFDIKRGKNGKK